MLVLALDTSTPSVTAGVVRLRRPHEMIAPDDGAGLLEPTRLLAERSITNAFAHAEQLMPLAKGALADAGRTLAELDAVVVGLGPGPFTGLRVGIATAAALGDGLDVPVHGVPSHDGLARSLAHGSWTGGELLVVTDARRREVYLSAYAPSGARLLGPLVVAPADVQKLLADHGVAPAVVAGAGSALLHPQHRPALVEIGGAAITLGLVERAAVPLLTGAVPGPLTPLYLRRPDATEPGARKSVLAR